MLCQKCQQRDATVRMTRIVNDQRETLFLCNQCAQEEGRFSLPTEAGGGIFDLFNSLLGGGAQAVAGNRWAARLTGKARQALAEAEKEARQRGSSYIDTEHILLGLFAVPQGLAGHLLREHLQLDAAELEAAIDDGANRGETLRGFSPHAKRALQLAAEEARRLGLPFVDTEHLLLGLAAEEEGLASHWLAEAGADAEHLRGLLLHMLQQGREQAPEGGEEEEGSPGFMAAGAGASGAEGQGAAGQAAAAGRGRKSKTPTLDKYGRDLTQMAREDKLDPVIGRAAEIERVMQILSRRTKNNPVLIGEPGVGKTAIAEGLAQLIVAGKAPETLCGKRVVGLDLSSVVAGSKYRGEFEERMKKLVDETKASRDVIIFIDEIHTILGAGAAEGSIDAANILKPALARGELQCVGATTLDEYRKHIEKDAALERRFQPVTVGEPTQEEALQILHGLRDKYEAHHRVRITDEALAAAVRLSGRYIPDRFLPDKAIDLIDEAASKTRLAAFMAPPDLKELESELTCVQNEKEAAVKTQEFERAASLRDREKELSERLEEARRDWQKQSGMKAQVVDAETVAVVLSDWVGVPVSRLNEAEAERLLKLEELLHQRVVGQDEAISGIARAVRRARAGLKDARRPVGSFLFLGPTGVGKTELAKALANVMFGSDEAMVRIDMSEYMEKYAVSRLVGAPPGYVGYDEGGQLTEAVRRRPYCVVLLDEIEKAHPDVFNILLQVLDDGRLTDSSGRTVDFRSAIIVMTSNVGAGGVNRARAMGFGAAQEDQAEESYQNMRERMLEALKQTFRPEFLNRVDESIVFRPLTEPEICQIAGLMLGQLRQRLADNELDLSVREEAGHYLAEHGFDQVFGARPLRRAIQRLVEDPISEAILAGEYQAGDTVEVYVEGEELKTRKQGQ